MLDIKQDIIRQIKTKKMNSGLALRFNAFFNRFNTLNKGTDKDLIKIEYLGGIMVNTNLLNDNMEVCDFKWFYKLFEQFLNGFEDNEELLYDIFELLEICGVIILSDNIRLKIFNKLYNSGYFNYVATNKSEFQKEWDYALYDLKTIARICSNRDLIILECDMIYILKELYGFKEAPCLRELIL